MVKMKKDICILPLVPVREKPSDRSQMINQLLFGDVVAIKDQYKSWLFAETLHDGYAGWVDEKQVTPFVDTYFAQLEEETPVFLNTEFTRATGPNGENLVLTLGSRLPLFRNNRFMLGEKEYQLPENISVLTGKQPAKKITETARKYLGSSFLWGGRSFFGTDCSGFTQIVFRMCGYPLQRDASQQAEHGTLVNFVEEARQGDLAFFENEEGSIIHVGILLDNQEIIHSSGQVRTDTVDHEGIFRTDLKKYTHKLRFIKRILP